MPNGGILGIEDDVSVTPSNGSDYTNVTTQSPQTTTAGQDRGTKIN